MRELLLLLILGMRELLIIIVGGSLYFEMTLAPEGQIRGLVSVLNRGIEAALRIPDLGWLPVPVALGGAPVVLS